MKTITSPWGKMWLLLKFQHCWVKIIRVNKGQRTSLQYHNFRKELHIGLNKFHVRYIPYFQHHRMTEGLYLEIAWGFDVREDDIIRLEDDYNRT